MQTRDQLATIPRHSTLKSDLSTEELLPLEVEGARTKSGRFWPFVPFTAVLAFMLLTLVFTLAHGIIADPDIWWHLHNADYLTLHHTMPDTDTYSFTVQRQPWMNHEWLAELPYYLAWRVLGLSGIHAISILILSVLFLGVLYLSYRESGNFKAAVLAAAYGVFLARVSFGPRTILFGYALLVAVLIILQRFRQKGEAPLWLIPIVFCVWINTHGSWFIGMIIFSIIVAGGLITLEWGFISSQCWTMPQKKNLLLAWGASVASLFVNPFGWRLVLYPLDLAFRQKLNSEHIHEWVSVDFHDARGKFVIFLLLFLLVSTLVRPRRWSLSEVAVTLFALYSGLTYVRFLCLLAIVIAPVLAKALDFLPPYRRELDTPMLNTFAILLMIVGIAYYWPQQLRLERMVNDQYPLQAVTYLQTHSYAGPVVNYYLWGGYLNWKDPNLKVFIDGRADIFEYSGVFEDYLSLLSIANSEVVLNKYKTRYVLFPPGEPLINALQHDPNWKTVYSDRVSVLMERTGT